MRKSWVWAATLSVCGAIAGSAQQPPRDAGTVPAVSAATSICTQWQQIQRLRRMSPAEARLLPEFEALRSFCVAVQEKQPLRLTPPARQQVITSACRDWRQLTALKSRGEAAAPFPALPELAYTCSQPHIAEMMKYSCTKKDSGTTFTSCCCLGELDCALADKAGSCTNDCRAMKESCELSMKGVFRVLPN